MILRAIVAFLLSWIAGPAHLAAPLPGWTLEHTGPDGGEVLTGRIPNPYVRDSRASAVYLPPGYDPSRRYPVLYLLHGLPGSPSSFYYGLHLAEVVDPLIVSGKTQPFIAVMPVGGPQVHPELGEWAAEWEKYVVHSVVPWTDAHLPTLRAGRGRALAGLSAGGYGAVDIGLRHAGMFRTLEAWAGYFKPTFRDGPFREATQDYLQAHNPSRLVRNERTALRKLGVGFYLSISGDHGAIKRTWTLDFDQELSRLRLQHRLLLLPRSHRTHFWRETFPSAVLYAATRFPAKNRPGYVLGYWAASITRAPTDRQWLP